MSSLARRFSFSGGPLPRPGSLLCILMLAGTSLLCGPRTAGGRSPYGASPAVIVPLLAEAPTTQPSAAVPSQPLPADMRQPIALAHESWEGVLHRFARALVDPVARTTEEPLFVPGSTVQQFGQESAANPRVIAERFDGFATASICPLIYPAPDALARIQADLSVDESPVPSAVREALVPAPRERSAAQSTFAEWIENALDPQPGDRYGVIILVQPVRPGSPSTTESPLPPGDSAFDRVNFLLVKAAQQTDGRWRLAHVRYGTLVEAIRYGF